MKKILMLTLVLALASLANAVNVSFESAGPIVATSGQTIRLNVVSDGSLLSLDALVTLDLTGGSGSVVGAMDADSAVYGWDPAGYPDSAIITATSAEFGGTQFNNNLNTIVGYIDILYTSGTLIANLSNSFGLNTGDTYDDQFNPITFSDSLTITAIPEPITMALLGIGGLFLRRRK